MDASTIKKPRAFVPLAMSLAALALILIHVAKFGIAPQADEGTSARLWQLLMAGQVPVVAFFAIKWLPRNPRQALQALALQSCLWLASLALVLWLER